MGSVHYVRSMYTQFLVLRSRYMIYTSFAVNTLPFFNQKKKKSITKNAAVSWCMFSLFGWPPQCMGSVFSCKKLL